MCVRLHFTSTCNRKYEPADHRWFTHYMAFRKWPMKMCTLVKQSAISFQCKYPFSIQFKRTLPWVYTHWMVQLSPRAPFLSLCLKAFSSITIHFPLIGINFNFIIDADADGALHCTRFITHFGWTCYGAYVRVRVCGHQNVWHNTVWMQTTKRPIHLSNRSI